MSIKSKLSDAEQEEIIAYVLAGRYEALIKYVNTLMYTRGLGSDVCARPYAYRADSEISEPCFAANYLRRIISFIDEQTAREPNNIALPTKQLVTGMLQEVDQHFNTKINKR